MGGPSANGDFETDYILGDIREMDRFAEQTQEAVKTTLTLVESDIANLQGMEAVKQGKIVLIFTLVTVWFLPLSFLTSLFALDVASFLTAPAWSLYVISDGNNEGQVKCAVLSAIGGFEKTRES
ncbi:hypothetical protein K4K58_011418 [Colletotrichum sp. SAR11_239]|nr:hypothetical protein K4K58_011418 [Colletotrichum sp. SAR11_239]